MASIVAQVAGVDALRIISMIAKSARNAKMHKRNCTQMAEHVKMIGKLLERLKTTELSQYPATSEPLEQLEEALGRALALVESCRDRSYLYLLAMGWSVVYQFRQVQSEIDRYLKILPLISLLDGCRIQERLQAIEEDHRDYTLDEEEMEAQNVILKSEHTKEDAGILEKSLSRRYPHLAFNEALEEENEKLHVELQRPQVINDPKQVHVIRHLIEVTENVLDTHPEQNQSTCKGSRHGSVKQASIKGDDVESEEPGKYEWQTDLLECCTDPCLCLKTCFYPCGTFVSIANVASAGDICKLIPDYNCRYFICQHGMAYGQYIFYIVF
eukprot:TRINITY_DN2723_c0_g1_i2.p1 TRINITY_DN2723_c0_g1~~TRINITY_DN2723_c0_g1_i2.p1  ORF type:complete len:327 (-),score=45.80 TRINITY_DN2723_c0_g1_i2:2246-3226(-)